MISDPTAPSSGCPFGL